VEIETFGCAVVVVAVRAVVVVVVQVVAGQSGAAAVQAVADDVGVAGIETIADYVDCAAGTEGPDAEPIAVPAVVAEVASAALVFVGLAELFDCAVEGVLGDRLWIHSAWCWPKALAAADLFRSASDH